MHFVSSLNYKGMASSNTDGLRLPHVHGGDRPGDVVFSVFHGGVVDEQQPSNFFYVGATAGLARVTQAEQFKIAKYAHLGFGPSATFIPAVASTSGAWGNKALEAFKFMAYHVNLTSRALELKKLRVLMATTVMKLVAADIKQVMTYREYAR